MGVAHGDPSMRNRTTAEAVRAQAVLVIAANPEFGRADDASKREYAEALLVQAALIDGLLERYRTNPAMVVKGRRLRLSGRTSL